MKSTMTETVLSWDHGGTAAAMAQNAQMTEEHSTLGQQTPGRLDHPAWCVVRTLWPASTWKHSEDADVNLRRQLSGGSQQGMTAPCHQGNDTREHIAGTEFSLELSTNVVHGGVELCALTSLRRTWDEAGSFHSWINAWVAGKTVWFLDNACTAKRFCNEVHLMKRRYMKCTLLYLYFYPYEAGISLSCPKIEIPELSSAASQRCVRTLELWKLIRGTRNIR